MMCLDQRENGFLLNPRVFSNNNVKLHYVFATNTTLITLQGSVHVIHTLRVMDNCYALLLRYIANAVCQI